MLINFENRVNIFVGVLADDAFDIVKTLKLIVRHLLVMLRFFGIVNIRWRCSLKHQIQRCGPVQNTLLSVLVLLIFTESWFVKSTIILPITHILHFLFENSRIYVI